MTNDQQVLSIYEGAAGLGAINLSPEAQRNLARQIAMMSGPPRLGSSMGDAMGLSTTEMVGVGVGVLALAAIAYYATR